MHLNTTIKFSKSHSVVFFNTIKLNLNYILQTANVSIQIYTADRLPCLGCQILKKVTIKTWENVPDSSPESDGFNTLRLYCSKLNPASLCYDSKPAKLPKARWAIQLLDHLLRLLNRASWRYFQERYSTVIFILKFFPYYRIVNLLHTYSVSSFRHFSQAFRRIQTWYRSHLQGDRLLACDFHKFGLWFWLF